MRSACTSWTIGAIAGALALGGCDRGGGDRAAAGNAVEAPPPAEPRIADAIPLPEPPLDREKLLLAVARAASAFAAGADDRQAQAELGGRQFTLRMRFGCGGPMEKSSAAAKGWSYDEGEQSLRVWARPDISKETPPAAAMAGEGIEAVEGFWIDRPWLFTEACPAGPQAASEPAPPTVGLAQFFTDTDSRVQRRSDRSYETVQKVAPESVPRAAGFSLVLSGRLKPLGEGRVVNCAAAGSNVRPVCLVSVEYDRVAIENAQSREMLAEWSLG